MFRVPALCDVKGNTAHPYGFAFTVAFDATAPGRPAHLPIWEHGPVLGFVFCAGVQRVLHRQADEFTILRMDYVSEALKVELLRRREAKQGAPFLRHPNLIALDVPNP